MTRQTVLEAFKASVAKASAKPPVKELSEALGALVKARLAPKPAPTQYGKSYGLEPWQRDVAKVLLNDMMAKPSPRRARRSRRGRNQAYRVTDSHNDARYGTFRHYMIETIVAHSDTWSAELAHGKCDNPKFAKNKLDFNWAAKNGFITFDI